MGDQMLDEDVREQVRQRYAAAAAAVTSTGRGALAVVEGDQRCGSGSPAANASCCGAGGAVDAAFGSARYSVDE
jgi:arsenite methyltransferase